MVGVSGMRDERGLTLVELLVAIVILGMILIPLLTIMTGATVRTLANEKGATNLYIAQEVIEKIRMNHGIYKVDRNSDGSERTYCFSKVTGICDGYQPFPSDFEHELMLENNQMIELTVSKVSDHPSFNQVEVVVANTVLDSEGAVKKKNGIEFVTAVKR